MAYPDKGEGWERGISNQSFNLSGLPSPRGGSWLRLGQRCDDHAFFSLTQELGFLVRVVRDPEVAEDSAEDCGDAFDNEDPSVKHKMSAETMRIALEASYRQPSSPPAPLMKDIANASSPLMVPENCPQA